jgi:CubicO group peptidase (beta-lactamase class C family)
VRFGLMMQNNGKVGDTQVLSKSWIDKAARGDSSVYGSPYTDICPNGAYANFWWLNNVTAGDFVARGVFGQMIYVNRTTELTIVKLSTWPDYLIPDFTRDALAAFSAIQNHLS